MHNIELKPDVKRREAELKESKDLLRVVLDNSADSIQVLEAVRNDAFEIIDFRWALINKAAEKALKENVVGQHVLPFNPLLRASGVFDKFVSVTNSGETIYFEHNSQWRGTNYWYHNTVVKLNDGIMLTSVDVTERKKKEHEIREANAFIEKVIAANPDLISINDAETGSLLYTNTPSFWSICNQSFDDVKGLYDYERAELMVHPDYLEKANEFVQKRKLLGDGETLEVELKLKSGAWICSRSRIFQRTDDGKPSQILSITTDISEGKITALKLKESTETLHAALNQFQTLVSNTPDVITRWDKDRSLLFANEAFEKRMRLETAALLGKNVKEMNVPEYISLPWDEKLQQVFDTSQAVDHYNPYPSPNGHAFYYSRLVPEFASNGSVQSVLAIARDITDLKKAENELITMKLQQQKAILNVIILTQEQERQRIGEALHNGVAQLLYGIQTHLQLLRVSGEPEKIKIQELLKIVQDAINDTRRVSFELVPAALKDYGLKVALQSLFHRIANERLEIRLQTNDTTFRLPEKIEFSIYRIVQELLNNIIKHSKATTAVVEIVLKRKNLDLKVTDNGIGFTKEKLNPMSKGIGLQSVKNRVKLLEGTMKIRSGNRGSSIVIQLPLKENNR